MPSTISTTEMNYREGPVEVREYDACHYMIVSGSKAAQKQDEENEDNQSGGRRLDGHEGVEAEQSVDVKGGETDAADNE